MTYHICGKDKESVVHLRYLIMLHSDIFITRLYVYEGQHVLTRKRSVIYLLIYASTWCCFSIRNHSSHL